MCTAGCMRVIKEYYICVSPSVIIFRLQTHPSIISSRLSNLGSWLGLSLSQPQTGRQSAAMTSNPVLKVVGLFTLRNGPFKKKKKGNFELDEDQTHPVLILIILNSAVLDHSCLSLA